MKMRICEDFVRITQRRHWLTAHTWCKLSTYRHLRQVAPHTLHRVALFALYLFLHWCGLSGWITLYSLACSQPRFSTFLVCNLHNLHSSLHPAKWSKSSSELSKLSEVSKLTHSELLRATHQPTDGLQTLAEPHMPHATCLRGGLGSLD